MAMGARGKALAEVLPVNRPGMALVEVVPVHRWGMALVSN